MKFTTAVIAIFASGIMASPFGNVPKCAKTCAIKYITDSGCKELGDFKCLCASQPFINGVTSCIPQACLSPQDAAASMDWARKTCEKVGVPLP